MTTTEIKWSPCCARYYKVATTGMWTFVAAADRAAESGQAMVAKLDGLTGILVGIDKGQYPGRIVGAHIFAIEVELKHLGVSDMPTVEPIARGHYPITEAEVSSLIAENIRRTPVPVKADETIDPRWQQVNKYGEIELAY